MDRSRHIIEHATYTVPESRETTWRYTGSVELGNSTLLPGDPIVYIQPAKEVEYISTYKSCVDQTGPRTEFHPCSIGSTKTRITPKPPRPIVVIPMHRNPNFFGFSEARGEIINQRLYTDIPSLEPVQQSTSLGLKYSDWNRMMTTAGQLNGTNSMNEVLAEISSFPRNVTMLAENFKSVAGASFGAAGLLQGAIDLLVCLSDWQGIIERYTRMASCELKRTMTYKTPDGHGYQKFICKYRIYPSMFLTPGCGALIEYLGLTTWGIHDLINLIPGAQLLIDPFIRYSRLDKWCHLNTTPYEISCNWMVVEGYKRKIVMENEYCYTVFDTSNLLRYKPNNLDDLIVADDWIGPSLRNWENLGLIKLPSIK